MQFGIISKIILNKRTLMSTIVSYTSEIKDIDITQILSIFKPIFTFTQITQTIKKK